LSSSAIVAISLGVVASILIASGAAYLAIAPRRVGDQFRVWAFREPASISEQVRRDDMSGEGKFLYLASFPKVESRRDFNQICSAVTIDTSILGCYIDSTKRIYLFHETDKRLDGTEEVMGAREMLRAAWDRMSSPMRAQLLVQLHHVLATNVDSDLNLSKRMATVRHNDPIDYDAELYATVGTEVLNVGPKLEASYAHFFVKRSVVTALNTHANAYIIALRKKVDALVATMNTLGNTIDGEVTTFNAGVSSLDADVDAFNARAERPGGFASLGQFNSARAALIARQATLQSTADQINSQVDVFNADLTKLKALDKTALSLVKSLNIDLEPVPDIIST
jgi:hypothetical protein